MTLTLVLGKTIGFLVLHTLNYIYQSHIVPCHLIKVVDLIDQTTNSWNAHLLNQYFHHIDVKCISQIPLPPLPSEDELA